MDRPTVEAVIELLNKKKARLSKSGHPAMINNGRLFVELVMEVDALCPRTPTNPQPEPGTPWTAPQSKQPSR